MGELGRGIGLAAVGMQCDDGSPAWCWASGHDGWVGGKKGEAYGHGLVRVLAAAGKEGGDGSP